MCIVVVSPGGIPGSAGRGKGTRRERGGTGLAGHGAYANTETVVRRSPLRRHTKTNKALGVDFKPRSVNESPEFVAAKSGGDRH